MFKLIKTIQLATLRGGRLLSTTKTPPVITPRKICIWTHPTTVMVGDTEWNTYQITSVRAVARNIVTGPVIYYIHVHNGAHYETTTFNNYLKYTQTLDMLKSVLDMDIIKED